MDIRVKTLTGQEHTLCDVNPDDTVLSVKGKIYDKEKIPTDQQKLIFSGKQLEDNKTIKDYTIGPGDLLHLTIRLTSS